MSVPSDECRCAWCGTAFRPRSSGGSSQRFCSSSCRAAFWKAAHGWIVRAMEVGLLSPETLKAVSSVNAAPSPR
jgi:hypothetical protein